MVFLMNSEIQKAWQEWHSGIDEDLVPDVNMSFERGFNAGIAKSDLIADDFASMLVYAARYAHSRNTGAAYQVVNVIERNWHMFNDDLKALLIRESNEAAFNFEDWERLRGFKL